MSTYSSIHAAVRMDEAARAVFEASTSWQWFDSVDPDDGAHIVRDGDGSSLLILDGRHYRNLNRYLGTDLFHAQKAGTVHGTASISCNDGSLWRCVMRFDGDHTLIGEGECLNLPVPATPAELTGIDLGAKDRMEFLCSGPGTPIDLYGFPTSLACSCAGWDEQDVAQCSTLIGSARTPE
jgi:hypothetical protein